MKIVRGGKGEGCSVFPNEVAWGEEKSEGEEEEERWGKGNNDRKVDIMLRTNAHSYFRIRDNSS